MTEMRASGHVAVPDHRGLRSQEACDSGEDTGTVSNGLLEALSG